MFSALLTIPPCLLKLPTQGCRNRKLHFVVGCLRCNLIVSYVNAMSEKQTVLSANNFNNEKNYYDGYELLQSSTYFYLVRLLHSGRFVLVYDCLILCFLSYFVSAFMSYLRMCAIANVPIQGYLFEKNSWANKIYTYREIGTIYCWQTASNVKAYVAQSKLSHFWVTSDKVEVVILPVVLNHSIFAEFRR